LAGTSAIDLLPSVDIDPVGVGIGTALALAPNNALRRYGIEPRYVRGAGAVTLGLEGARVLANTATPVYDDDYGRNPAVAVLGPAAFLGGLAALDEKGRGKLAKDFRTLFNIPEGGRTVGVEVKAEPTSAPTPPVGRVAPTVEEIAPPPAAPPSNPNITPPPPDATLTPIPTAQVNGDEVRIAAPSIIIPDRALDVLDAIRQQGKQDKVMDAYINAVKGGQLVMPPLVRRFLEQESLEELVNSRPGFFVPPSQSSPFNQYAYANPLGIPLPAEYYKHYGRQAVIERALRGVSTELSDAEMIKLGKEKGMFLMGLNELNSGYSKLVEQGEMRQGDLFPAVLFDYVPDIRQRIKKERNPKSSKDWLQTNLGYTGDVLARLDSHIPGLQDKGKGRVVTMLSLQGLGGK